MDKRLSKIIKEKDLEAFKIYYDFKSLSEIEKDKLLLDFELITTNFETPSDYLEKGIKGLFQIAEKYNIDAKDIFKEVVENRNSNK